MLNTILTTKENTHHLLLDSICMANSSVSFTLVDVFRVPLVADLDVDLVDCRETFLGMSLSWKILNLEKETRKSFLFFIYICKYHCSKMLTKEIVC